MARALAIPLTLVLAAAFALLLYASISVADLPLCSDPDGAVVDDCIEGSDTERALGLASALAAVLAAAAGTWSGARFVRGRTGKKVLMAALVATPVFALLAVFLLPVSF